jgi:hypothetical protein
MDDNNITINCLIVPIGKLMNIPCVKVMQAITIEKDECYSILEATIQSRLGVEIPLKICIIQAGSNNEEVMNSRASISDYFTEEPKAEHFHITVYPVRIIFCIM